jgi:hypothetical protein
MSFLPAVVDGTSSRYSLVKRSAIHRLWLAVHVLHCLPSIETLFGRNPFERTSLTLAPGYIHSGPSANPILILKLKAICTTDGDTGNEILSRFVEDRLQLQVRSARDVCVVDMYNAPGVSDWKRIKLSLEEGQIANGVCPADD